MPILCNKVQEAVASLSRCAMVGARRASELFETNKINLTRGWPVRMVATDLLLIAC